MFKNCNKIKLPIKKKGAVYLRFNIQIENKEILLDESKKQSIFLGNWYSSIIDPKGVNYEKIGYKIGSCPIAEKVARLSVNLPTYPGLTEEEIKKIAKLILNIYGNKRN
uniref:DegT/DnrJ/EryC1/StrS aminotransferase family protein n=1 Tax=candidate division CPR3 bacterium TaxID=2268181 RepID=A0A7C4R3E2_UNCC3